MSSPCRRRWRLRRGPSFVNVCGSLKPALSTTPFSRPSTIFDSTFTTKKAEHFGLGLAIVKKLVEAHGGKVCVESESPEKDAEKVARKGAAFIITLPHDGQGQEQRLC